MNQKTCNPEGLRAYPEALRALPYCNWRYEEVKGQQRKVPYNSITGAKASSNRIETLTTLENALAVAHRYAGVIVKVSGKVGFIDIDKCVREDGSLDERAQRILSLLPDVIVEYSPSGRGLHVIFLVPEGYVFDRDEYFVNNKEIHVENYFPGYNNQLMTMTGNLYRDGSMEVINIKPVKEKLHKTNHFDCYRGCCGYHCRYGNRPPAVVTTARRNPKGELSRLYIGGGIAHRKEEGK